jgi:beclin 1
MSAACTCEQLRSDNEGYVSRAQHQPQPVELAAASLHEQLRMVARLVELSTDNQRSSPSVGVPLCEDCASGVLHELQRRLEEAHAERELLRTASAELLVGEEMMSDDHNAADSTTEDAEFAREREAQAAEEARLRAALASAKDERKGLSQELARLREERVAQMEAEEERHAVINRAVLARQEAAEEALRAGQLVAACEREIRRLRTVDVLSDVFAIDLDAPIATINGLRLGRQPGTPVEWAELNAALGQVVLIVHTLGRLHLPGAAFQQHVLTPHGSLCRVHSRKDPARVYELYGSGRFGSTFFGNTRFDRGQSMLLACVAELTTHALAHFNPHASFVPPQPPHGLKELGSLVGSSSAADAKKLLAVLSWCLLWSRAARSI